MGYGIKYSTSNVSNTLRKGNVVTTAAHSADPSENFHAGIPIVDGKHNIVKVHSTNDPDFWSLTDVELLNLVNSLGGNVEDWLAAKNWINTQSDMFYLNNAVRSNIVTDGLVLGLNGKINASFVNNLPTTNLSPAGGRTGDSPLPRQSYHIRPFTYSIEQNIVGRDSVIRLYIDPPGGDSPAPYADYGFHAYKSGGSQVGDVYTISMDYYVVKGNSSPAITIAYANGYKNPTSAQAASWGSATIIDLGNGWYRRTQSATITVAGNTWWRGGLGSNNIETEAYIDNIQVELNSIATPFVDGTRTQNTAWEDISGNSNDSTLTNSPTFENGAIVFDGVDDYATINSDSSFNVNIRTVELTFKMNGSYSNFAPLAVYANGSSSTNRVWLGLQNSKFQMHGWGTSDPSATTTISADKWYTCVWSYDKGTQKMKMYTNGVLENDHSQTQGGVSGVAGMNWYLAHVPGSWQSQTYAATSISSFKVYDKILSNSEVSQNYYGGPIITENLQLCVDAGNLVSYESSSTTTYDMVKGDEGDGYSSYDSDGTLTNGVLFNEMNGGTWDFDGTDDYITFGPSAFQYQYDDAFSLEVWVNPDAVSGFKHLIGVTFGSYRLALSNNKISFRLDSNNLTTNSGNVVAGEWTHIVATWDPSSLTAKVYQDGELAQSVTNETVNWTSQGTNFQIGNSPGESYYFNGKIAMGKVYNKTLTSEEVQQNYIAHKSRFSS